MNLRNFLTEVTPCKHLKKCAVAAQKKKGYQLSASKDDLSSFNDRSKYETLVIALGGGKMQFDHASITNKALENYSVLNHITCVRRSNMANQLSQQLKFQAIQ